MCRSATPSAFFAAVLFLQTSPALGHDGEKGHDHKPVAVGPAEMYAPSRVPDRVILTWVDAPTTTQAVTWRTSADVRVAFAEIAEALPGPGFPKRAERFDATSRALTTDINTAQFHTVVFKELKPRTKYAYRVGDGVNFSEWFQFRTASDQAEPFSFVYFGDAQNDVRSMWSRVIREAYSDAPKSAFLLHAGDLINRAEADGEWGEWFGAGGWVNGTIPNIAVPGNHEHIKRVNQPRRLSNHWRPTFAFPEHGPEGTEETCYTLVYQGVRIVAMNSTDELEAQAKWLDEVLTDNEEKWVVCTFHHPIFSTGRDRDNATLRALWKPVLDKHRVDIVLQGHDHTYGRTGLDTPLAGEPLTAAAAEPGVQDGEANVPTGLSGQAKTGTVYVVSVSGPKMYPVQPQPFMPVQAQNMQLYQVIRVDGDKMTYEARTAVGDLYDAFTLVKQSGDINKLIEQPPTKRPSEGASAGE